MSKMKGAKRGINEIDPYKARFIRDSFAYLCCVNQRYEIEIFVFTENSKPFNQKPGNINPISPKESSHLIQITI